MNLFQTEKYTEMESRFKILTVKITAINSYESIFNKIRHLQKNSKSSEYITINNVHTIVESQLDKNYEKILNNSKYSLADGRPLTLYAKIKYKMKLPRIFGPSLMEKVIDWGQCCQIRHYFFGSKEETLRRLKTNLINKFPDIKIAGMEAPVFGEFSCYQNQKYIENIIKSSPHIIWVSLGAPKQEKWIYDNFRKLKSGIFIGIGAGFSYLADETQHAPEWMKEYALEWIFRLYQEPERLLKRYLKYNTLFIYYLFMEICRQRTFRENP